MSLSPVASDGIVEQPSDVKTCLSLLVAVTLGAASVAVAHGESAWLTDYKKAEQQAKSEKKLVLLNFTGSDWCGWCIRLNKEVFSQPQFKEYASKNLVLVELDFPRGKSQPAAEKMQNEELAQKFQIQGFPTIVVLNADGKIVGELGYTEGGPSTFLAELEKIRKG